MSYVIRFGLGSAHPENRLLTELPYLHFPALGCRIRQVLSDFNFATEGELSCASEVETNSESCLTD